MNLNLAALLDELVQHNGSDLHLVSDHPPLLRIHGTLQPGRELAPLSYEMIQQAMQQLISKRQFDEFIATRELDAGVTTADGIRLRVNLYIQQETIAAAIRRLPNTFFRLDQLGLDKDVTGKIVNLRTGLVLVTGATGSGKSTTIASMVNEINQQRACHIHTIEDPVEYRHVSCKRWLPSVKSGVTLPALAKRCAAPCARIRTSLLSVKCATWKPPLLP